MISNVISKPTSSTAKGNHNTWCVTGGGSGSSASCTSSGSGAATDETAAHHDSSKRYGNGKTAAQIANERGAHAGTKLYGPGNSQPHTRGRVGAPQPSLGKGGPRAALSRPRSYGQRPAPP